MTNNMSVGHIWIFPLGFWICPLGYHSVRLAPFMRLFFSGKCSSFFTASLVIITFMASRACKPDLLHSLSCFAFYFHLRAFKFRPLGA